MSRFPLALLFLSGCDGCTETDPLADVADEIPANAVDIWMGQGSGVGAAEVPVLTVNEVGAAVAAADTTLASDGALTSATVSPDAFGWAFAEVTAAAPGAWSVSGTSGGVTATGTAFVTALPDVHSGFSAWLSGGQDTPVAQAGAGVATVSGNEVWWTATAGGAPVRVAALGNPVLGIRRTAVDTDGVADLLAWSEDEAVILRGRPEGGLAFEGGWRTKTDTIRAFLVTNLDDDALADVLLVTGDANTSTIVWMANDGSGGWQAQATLEQDYAVYGATAEDLDEDGLAEVSLLTGDGILRRFAWLGKKEGWLASSKADSTLGIAEGAQMFGGLDMDGDLLDEVVVVGPKVDETGYAAYAVSSGSDVPLIYAMTSNMTPTPSSMGASLTDADGDGLADVFLSTPDALYRASWSAAMAQLSLTQLSGLPGSLSIDAADLTGDGYADVVVSRAAAIALVGETIADDPETDNDESVPWTTATPWSGLFDLGLSGDPWMGDFNDDGVVDLVAFVQNGDPALQAFYGVAANGNTAENLRAARAVALFATDVPLDLAVCDGSVWALITSTSGTEARRYSIDGFGVLALKATIAAPSGVAIACGTFADGQAAVVDGVGGVLWIDGATGTAGSGVGNLTDIVAADRDGDGLDELVGCEGLCTIAAGDFDADGTDDVVWSDGLTTTASIGGVERTLGLGGFVSAADADGDGVVDMLVQSDGVLAAWRGLGGQPGVPFLSAIARAATGRGHTGDLDGDGLPDAFWLGFDTNATDSADWTGTLLYGKSAAE